MQVRKQLPNYEDLLRNFVTSKAVKPCADQFISSTCLSEEKKYWQGFPPTTKIYIYVWEWILKADKK